MTKSFFRCVPTKWQDDEGVVPVLMRKEEKV